MVDDKPVCLDATGCLRTDIQFKNILIRDYTSHGSVHYRPHIMVDKFI